MKEYQQTIDYLIKEGAEYADVRFHSEDLTESLSVLNGDVDDYSYSSVQGYGIRVLYEGAWGFASSEDLGEAAIKAASLKALQNAASAAQFVKERVSLAPKKVLQSEYSTPRMTDPFVLPLKEKTDYLVKLNNKLAHPKIDFRRVSMNVYRRKIHFFDSEGARIEKNLLDLDASLYIDGKDMDGFKQRRTYNLYHQKNGKVGWENLLSESQFDHCERLQKELLQVLEAPQCEEEVCDIILLPEMMALQTHETIGHALELDRILGYELSYAGGSHIDLQHFGELKFGSEKLTARADGTVVCSPGSTGFDDDGVPGKNVTLIKNGVLQNAITSRQMIVEANLKAGRQIFSESGGACRAESYNQLPIERMNNINVDAGGDGSFEDIVSSCKNGLILESPRSWSIGSNRENFHFATEIGWKVKDGKVSHVVRNPTYRGDSLKFWRSLERVGGESTWQLQQVFHCGKGQPNQTMRLGHGVPVCLFANVQVGN